MRQDRRPVAAHLRAFAEQVSPVGWHTDRIEDVNDLAAIDAAIERAKADPRPTMVAVRTVIGYGSPNRAGTEKAHGEALGEEEVKLTKQALGWPTTDTFWVPQEALDHIVGWASDDFIQQTVAFSIAASARIFHKPPHGCPEAGRLKEVKGKQGKGLAMRPTGFES